MFTNSTSMEHIYRRPLLHLHVSKHSLTLHKVTLHQDITFIHVLTCIGMGVSSVGISGSLCPRPPTVNQRITGVRWMVDTASLSYFYFFCGCWSPLFEAIIFIFRLRTATWVSIDYERTFPPYFTDTFHTWCCLAYFTDAFHTWCYLSCHTFV